MKYFTCPKCGNNTMCAAHVEAESVYDLDFHELCICEECGAELYAEPHFGNTVSFVSLTEDELEEEEHNRLTGKAYLNHCHSS